MNFGVNNKKTPIQDKIKYNNKLAYIRKKNNKKIAVKLESESINTSYYLK